ncbi:MAG: hypothetical protein AAGJ94_01220 [Pseudomonadota bacterium]
MILRKVFTALAGFLIGWGTSLSLTAPTDGLPVSVTVGVSASFAQSPGTPRRVARRTSRRTARRTAYRNSLPGGCVRRNAYYYCGGVYYQPVVQNGVTVYVVVNP